VYGWLDDLGLVLNQNQIQPALIIIQQFVNEFCLAVNARKTVILNLASNSTPTFIFCAEAITASPKHFVTKCLGVYISGSKEEIQSKLENDLVQDFNQLSVYDFDPAARAFIVSNKLVPRYAYRLTLYASAQQCIKNLQARMAQWVREGGSKKLSCAGDEAQFTCRPQGGLGIHRLNVRLCMQLVCLVFKTLQDYPSNHPLHSSKSLLTALAQTPNTSHGNIIHSYKNILQQCDIQSPMLGQPLITKHFKAQLMPVLIGHWDKDWLIDPRQPAPHHHQLDLEQLHRDNPKITQNVISTLQKANTFKGEIVYVDGSAKDGQAGSSFYFPRTGLCGKQRVAGMQTSG
jgi:hypothetical protein